MKAKPIPPLRLPKVERARPQIIPRPTTVKEARAMAARLGRRWQGARFLTAREIDQMHSRLATVLDKRSTELTAGIDWMRAELAYRQAQRGFSLIELCCAMLVSAILAAIALPSFLNHYLREQLQVQVVSLEHGLLSTPALPLDASWTFTSPSTYSKTFTPPTAGTLQVVAPVTSGGAFSCTWNGNALITPRC